MWFLFGFITLTSFTLFMGYKRLNASWKGETRFTKDTTYQQKISTNKGKVTKVLIGIDGPEGYDFSFKKETIIDRFCKSIGLSKEYEVGSIEFDKLVYIVSDDQDFHTQIKTNQKIIELVPKIFDGTKGLSCEIKEIRCNSGRLWIKVSPKSGFEEYIIPKLAERVASLLSEISDELKAAERTVKNKWNDPFVLKAAVILAISSGLAINGLAHIMRLIWEKVPFTVDSSEMFQDAFLAESGIVILLVISTFFLLGRTARTHLVLIELLLIGYFGAVSTSFAEMRDINMELDNSEGRYYEVIAQDKEERRSRKSTSYYLYLEDWTKESIIREIKVSSSMYHKINIGDTLSVTQKDGLLGYRWVESLNKKY